MRSCTKLIITLLIIFLNLKVFAVPSSQPTTNAPNPNIVKVGLHLLGIDQLDLYKGTYAMDAHLIFNCTKVCPKLTPEIMNGAVSSMDVESSTPTQKIYRVKMLLQDNFDAKDYPFDSYWLRVELKDQFLNKDQLIFVADPKLVIIDPGVILHGWQYNFRVKSIADERTHPLLNEVFSKYTFMIELRRPLLMGFLKVIFPAVIIMLFAFISFFVTADKSINRLGIVSGALIGSILFHINLTSSLPPLGYLTFVDMFMIINYLLLFIILFENVYVMRLADSKREKLSIKIDRIGICTLPPLWVLLQIINALLFFVF